MNTASTYLSCTLWASLWVYKALAKPVALLAFVNRNRLEMREELISLVATLKP